MIVLIVLSILSIGVLIGYLIGIIEAKKVYICRACEYFDWFLQEKVTTPDYKWVCKQIADFRKAMEDGK